MKTNNFGAVKGHFYNVEKRFESVTGLRAKMESTAKSLDLDKSDLKKCMTKIKADTNYLWIVIGKRNYLVQDVTMGWNCEEKSKTFEVIRLADYIYNVTTWRVDGYRFREVSKEKFMERVGA